MQNFAKYGLTITKCHDRRQTECQTDHFRRTNERLCKL